MIASRSDDHRASVNRKLHGKGPDRACSPVDQHRPAHQWMTAIHALVRRHRWNSKARALIERQVIWKSDCLLGG